MILLYQQLIIVLKKLLATLTSKSMPQITTTLDRFCLSIRDYEGGPEDANYRNNNPGNCRYNPDGYLAKYGNVTESTSGFAVFPSYDLGWEYLEAMISGRIQKHPNWTYLQFFENYAPTSDNNVPFAYAVFVAKRVGVEVNTLIKTILE